MLTKCNTVTPQPQQLKPPGRKGFDYILRRSAAFIPGHIPESGIAIKVAHFSNNLTALLCHRGDETSNQGTGRDVGNNSEPQCLQGAEDFSDNVRLSSLSLVIKYHFSSPRERRESKEAIVQ